MFRIRYYDHSCRIVTTRARVLRISRSASYSRSSLVYFYALYAESHPLASFPSSRFFLPFTIATQVCESANLKPAIPELNRFQSGCCALFFHSFFLSIKNSSSRASLFTRDAIRSVRSPHYAGINHLKMELLLLNRLASSEKFRFELYTDYE